MSSESNPTESAESEGVINIRIPPGTAAVLSIAGIGFIAGVTAILGLLAFSRGGMFVGSLFILGTFSAGGMLYTGYITENIGIYKQGEAPETATELELEEEESEFGEALGAVLNEQLKVAPIVLTMIGSVLTGVGLLFAQISFDFSPEWVALLVFRFIGFLFLAAPLAMVLQAHLGSDEDEEGGEE